MFQKLKQLFAHAPAKPVLANRSTKWPEFRQMWLLTQPVCQACGTEKKVQVHHIIPVHIDPTKELDGTNVITLCELSSHDCHYHIGHLLNWKAYNPTCVQDAATFKTAIENRPYAPIQPLPPSTTPPALPPSSPLTTPVPTQQIQPAAWPEEQEKNPPEE